MIQIPDISIIIPCYNEGYDLLRAVESVKKCAGVVQYEIIIVDDCSTHAETHAILQKIAQEDFITVLYLKENKGPGIARNIAIEQSNAPWIVLLDSDDVLLNNAIEIVFMASHTYPEADFFFWNYMIYHVDNDEYEEKFTSSLTEENSNKLDPYKLARNFIIPGCSPFKKDMWKRIGGYNAELSKGGVEDIDFWRRAVMAGAKGYHINEFLYQWNRKSTGNNSNIDEAKYMLHRKNMLPYYDTYIPEYGIKMREYIYRYYSQRLQVKELQEFVSKENTYFSFIQKCKSYIMSCTLLYKILRKLKNTLLQLFS